MTNHARVFALALILAAVLVVSPFGVSKAGELAPAKGRVILEVSGAIANTNGDGVARFDLAMLESLAQKSFTTSTRWTDTAKTFEGVGGKAFIDAVGASGSVAVARALNDYKIEIPIEDFTSDRLLIAYRIDGAVPSVREKGPLWIVYNYDSDDALKTEVYFGRSIWQLMSLEFR
jgi:hypothetical protein